MKWLLLISVVLNCYFAYQWYALKSKPPLERVVVESHPKIIIKREAPLQEKIPTKKSPKEIAENKQPPAEVPVMEKALEEMAEKIEDDKSEFLTMELNLSPQEIESIEKLKNRANRQIDELYIKNGNQDLSVEFRRQILTVEENLQKEMLDLLGPEKWQRYHQFREEYNRRLLEEGSGGSPVILMDI